MKKTFFFTCAFYLTAYSFLIHAQTDEPDTIDVYLVKESWHTGLMFGINDFTIRSLPVLKYFEGFEYADIGWGDADFYQNPGFDLYLAAKAILIPTPTVIRIDGYKFPIEKIIEWREFAIKFKLPKERFLLLVGYINNHIRYDNDNEPIISKREKDKPIIFFKSFGEYYLFRTCNTWAAEALQATGIDVDTFCLITAGQLYSKLAKFGSIVKEFD
ncbi:MAG: DUF2459 domain-containing protein [Bacteroidetes bacterium]|nr:DUF2459 domain-containing protein [Bacteroidota bacterium]